MWLPACGHLYWANYSHPHACPFDGPSGGLRSTALFLRDSRTLPCCWGQSSTSHRRWAPHGVSVRGGATPPSAGSRASLPVGVGPCGGVAPPRRSLPCPRSRPRRSKDTEGTTSSLGDVPPHAPRAVPAVCSFAKKTGIPCCLHDSRTDAHFVGRSPQPKESIRRWRLRWAQSAPSPTLVSSLFISSQMLFAVVHVGQRFDDPSVGVGLVLPPLLLCELARSRTLRGNKRAHHGGGKGKNRRCQRDRGLGCRRQSQLRTLR